MWGRCNKVNDAVMDLTGAPFTSAPTQTTAPTNLTPVGDGWYPLCQYGEVLSAREVMDELYLLIYTDATDVDLTPWFYCPEFIAAGTPLVGKHVPGTLLEDVPATGSPTSTQGSIFRIPVPPMATHVRIQRGTQTGGTYCKAELFTAEEL
jgi:hypothetical protein